MLVIWPTYKNYWVKMGNVTDSLWLHLYHMIFSTSLNNFLGSFLLNADLSFFGQYFHPIQAETVQNSSCMFQVRFTFIRSASATYIVLIWVHKDIVYFLDRELLNLLMSCSLWRSVFGIRYKLGWAFCPDTAWEVCFMKIHKLCGGWITAWTWAMVGLNMCKKSLWITEIIN